MKKITALFIALIFLISIIAVSAEDNVQVKQNSESDVQVSDSVVTNARTASSLELCVKILKDAYPNIDVNRLQTKCVTLRSQVKEEVQNRTLAQIKEQRLEKLKELKAAQLERLQKLGEDKVYKLGLLTNRTLSKIAELDQEQLEKLAALDRTSLKDLSEKNISDIRYELGKLKVVKIKTEALYRNRVIAENKIKQAEQNYEKAKARYEQLKENISKDREEFNNAVRSGNETAAIERAKTYLTKVADLVISGLQKMKSEVESNNDLTDAEAANITADLDAKIQLMEDAKAKVEAAQTKEEVRAAGQDIIKAWEHMKDDVELHAGRIIKAKVGEVLVRSDQLAKNLDKTLAKLEDQGYNVSNINDLVDKFNAKISDARDKFGQAKVKFDLAQNMTSQNVSQDQINEVVNQGKDLVKNAQEDLQEAHNIFKEIVQKVRDQTGSIDAITSVEENETEVVVNNDTQVNDE